MLKTTVVRELFGLLLNACKNAMDQHRARIRPL
jgi:hypothetical protein